jgi:hypothetical protein
VEEQDFFFEVGLFFIYFLGILCFSASLEVALGNTRYYHHDSYIPDTGFMLVLLDHGPRTNERDPSILYNLSRDFAHELHYFEVGHRPRRDIRKHEIASPGKWNSKQRIHVGPLESWLKDK